MILIAVDEADDDQSPEWLDVVVVDSMKEGKFEDSINESPFRGKQGSMRNAFEGECITRLELSFDRASISSAALGEVHDNVNNLQPAARIPRCKEIRQKQKGKKGRAISTLKIRDQVLNPCRHGTHPYNHRLFSLLGTQSRVSTLPNGPFAPEWHQLSSAQLIRAQHITARQSMTASKQAKRQVRKQARSLTTSSSLVVKVQPENEQRREDNPVASVAESQTIHHPLDPFIPQQQNSDC